MTSIIQERFAPRATPRTVLLAPWSARSGLVAIVVLAAVAGFMATGSDNASRALSQADPDLTRLLRFMALLKCTFVAGLVAATWWRFGVPVRATRFAAYAASCAAMAAGPGLIWCMAHVGWGALLLHGGLLATGACLWWDPAVITRLEAAVRRRRREPTQG